MININKNDILNLIKKFPNDYDLGRKVRERFRRKNETEKMEVLREKHDKPLLRDWDAFAENDECVNVVIDESLDIESGKIIFKGKDREPLVEMKLNSRDIHICISIGDPMFVELHTKSGVSVKYVKGSGKEHYKEISLGERSN